MSPKTRQSTINFRVKKNVCSIPKHDKFSVASSAESPKNYKSKLRNLDGPEENTEITAQARTPKRNYSTNDSAVTLLTPSSALATLQIGSPAVNCSTPSAITSLNINTDELPCRETEIKEIEEFLLASLFQKNPASLYISGLPGTGKTAALTKVIENKKVANECQTVFVNCTAVKSSGAIYLRIAESLKVKLTSKMEKAAVAAIDKCLIKKKSSRKQKMVLLVLDEIDQLESKFQSVLYRIFEWPSKPNSRLVLVGIANAVDLTDRMLPRLRTLALKPRLLHFRPYTKDQICTILRHRLSQTDEGHLFAPGALELIAAKVAGQSGDLRRALDLGRRVLELSRSEHSNEKLKSSYRKLISDTSDASKPPTTPRDRGDGMNTERSAGVSGRTPRKLSTAGMEGTTPVSSPRKRVRPLWNEEKDDESVRVLRKTPRKTFLVDGETRLEKENQTVASRKSPRNLSSPQTKLHQPGLEGTRGYCKQLFGVQPLNILTSPAKANTPGGPRKQLFSEDDECETVVHRSKSPARRENLRTPHKQLSVSDREGMVAVKVAGQQSPLSGPRKTPRRHSVVSSNTEELCASSRLPTNVKCSSVTPRKSPRKKLFSLQSEENLKSPVKSFASPRKSPRKLSSSIHASDVLAVVAQMSASAHNLRAEESAFPLHQKLLICTLLLILTKGKNKDVTVGKLHEVYGRVCSRRGISAVDQSGFISLCRQVEMAGGVEIGKGPGRLAKVSLQWDEKEVARALQDSSLLAAIMSDTSVLAKK